MSRRKIERVLKKKNIPYECIDIDHATCCASTEWNICFTDDVKQKIINLSDGDITEDDFFNGFGGDAESVAELLDMLPFFDKSSDSHD